MGLFPDGWAEEDVEAVVARGNPDELLYVPIMVGMNADVLDLQWAQNICFSLVEHTNFNVRGNAILGLGHIARTCRELDVERAIPAISKALSDSHDFVRGHAESAACDLHVYLGILVPGYNEGHTEELYSAIDDLRKQHGI